MTMNKDTKSYNLKSIGFSKYYITDDGKIFETEVLEDATFLVPYHQLWTDYVSGEFIDWNQDEEDRFVYFPYETSNQYLPNLSSLLHKILP